MTLTEKEIKSYRMQICPDCKRNGDNIICGDEICHGTDADIEYCIDANLDSMVGDC